MYKNRKIRGFIAREARSGLRRSLNSKGEKTMLWTIIAILVVLWLLGFIGHIGGGLIHLLLVIAVVVLIFQLISGRRAVI
jgi:hypothetical protein